MTNDPILLVGGSGKVGEWTMRHLRAAHPDIPFLIGGRDQDKAQAVAAAFGQADAVPVDLEEDDLGLGDVKVSAVAVFFTEDRLSSVRFAQSRGVPHVAISRGLFEIGAEVAYYTHRPNSSAIVLGTEWLVGATTIPTMMLAESFARVDHVSIGALLDEEDTTGPAGFTDFDRQNEAMPSALSRQNGEFVWRVGDDIKTHFRAADGRQIEASAFSVNDVIGLAAAMEVPNIDFKLAIGTSSNRRQGKAFSTEIIIELTGQDRSGKAMKTRHAVIHPEGQMPLTGLGVALLLERLLGLDGLPKVEGGLHLPYQLLDQKRYLARFHEAGGMIVQLGD